jgi:WD40 repeat protein
VVALVDLADGGRRVVATHPGRALARFLDDGRTVASTSDGRALELWDDPAGAASTIRAEGAGPAQVTSLLVAPDGRSLYSGDRDGRVRRWDLQARAAHELRREDGPVTKLLSCAPGLLADTTLDGVLASSDLASGIAIEQRLPAPIYDARCAGRHVVAALADGSVQQIDPERGEVHELTRHATPAIEVVALADGSIASVSERGAIAVVAPDGHATWLQEGGATIQRLAAHPGAPLIATAGLDGSIQLWDPRDGTRRRIAVHRGGAVDVAFSRDGARLASIGRDGRVRLWNPAEVGLPPAERRQLSAWLHDLTDQTPAEEWRRP